MPSTMWGTAAVKGQVPVPTSWLPWLHVCTISKESFNLGSSEK